MRSGAAPLAQSIFGGERVNGNNIKTRTVLAAIAATLLCAEAYAADNGTGKIIVYYSASKFQYQPVINTYLVKPEGQQGVALHGNRYCEFVVPPGTHTLIIKHPIAQQDTIEVPVKSGETVYVECHVIPLGGWTFEVSEDQAHAKLRVSQLKPQIQ
jgi:hypothetical protein